jgi:hypothetical protein
VLVRPLRKTETTTGTLVSASRVSAIGGRSTAELAHVPKIRPASRTATRTGDKANPAATDRQPRGLGKNLQCRFRDSELFSRDVEA